MFQITAEVHAHNHFYLILGENGSVLELPGLTNTDPDTAVQVG